MIKNFDIREKIKDLRLFNYEIAQELKISEFTFCVWLRNDLTKEKKELILGAITKLSEK